MNILEELNRIREIYKPITDDIFYNLFETHYTELLNILKEVNPNKQFDSYSDLELCDIIDKQINTRNGKKIAKYKKLLLINTIQYIRLHDNKRTDILALCKRNIKNPKRAESQ